MTGIRVSRIFVVALFAAALALSGCRQDPAPRESTRPGAQETTTIAELAEVQIRDYRGKQLGSIEDFRENSIKGPQRVDRESYRLRITGLVDKPATLTYADVLGRPHFEKFVRLDCVEGWGVDILWEGVKLADLLDESAVDANANTVIFRCADGYSTSLPLSLIRKRDILLAYKMNGVELPAERGFPFQVVAEDKWGYKWAKWVTAIELGNDPGFKGYWESRGYDNDATLPSKR